MAQCVDDNANKFDFPEYLFTIFTRAIRFRREVVAWFRANGGDSEYEARHDAFAGRLQGALNMLRKYLPNRRTKKAEVSHSFTTVPLENVFEKLELHDTSDDDDKATPAQVNVEDMPSVPDAEIGVDVSHIEEEFWIQITAFLKETWLLNNIILEKWKENDTDLITKSIVTNTAIDLVRRRENEL